MSDSLISASHLSKSFGSVIAVNDVSLQIQPGEIYGLVGSDGAGKTTTLRLLIGALKTDMGSVLICGYDVMEMTEQARSQVGYLSQRFSLYEDLSVLENIRFFAEVRGLSSQKWLPRCLEILEFVGLVNFKDRRTGQLSGGMKQKLGLASALVTHPKVLLLDEPTTGVDPVTRQDFWQLIIRIASQEGVSVLLTTPYMDEASRCGRVGFMRLGQIIAEGTPTQLRSTLERRIIEARAPSLQELRKVALKIHGVEDVRTFGDKLHLRTYPDLADSVLLALSDAFPDHVLAPVKARVIPPTLEDVFISLSG